ncbi:MAG: hypothetical protein ACRDD8_14245 [Bacteroidales bacterium]
MNITDYLDNISKEKQEMVEVLRATIIKVRNTYTPPSEVNYDGVMDALEAYHTSIPTVNNPNNTLIDTDYINNIIKITDNAYLSNNICESIKNYNKEELNKIIDDISSNIIEHEHKEYALLSNRHAHNTNEDVYIACNKLYNRLLYVIKLMISTRIPSFKLLHISILPIINRLKSLHTTIGLETKTLTNVLNVTTSKVMSNILYYNKYKECNAINLTDTTNYFNRELCGDNIHTGVYDESNDTTDGNYKDLFNLDNIKKIRCTDTHVDLVKYKNFTQLSQSVDCNDVANDIEVTTDDAEYTNEETYKSDKAIVFGITLPIHTTISAGVRYGNWVSPISGTVTKISQDKIYIKDVKDIDNNSIESGITDLIKLYDYEQKIFEFYTASYYKYVLPIMMYNTRNNVPFSTKTYKTYKELIGICENHMKQYEQDIKTYGGEDNVKKHAKNETLSDVYDDITKSKNKLYNKIEKSVLEYIAKCNYCSYEKTELDLLEYYVCTVLPTCNFDTDVDVINKMNQCILDIIKRRTNSSNKHIIINAINKRGEKYDISYRDLLSKYSSIDDLEKIKGELRTSNIDNLSYHIILELFNITLNDVNNNDSLTKLLKLDTTDITNAITDITNAYKKIDLHNSISTLGDNINIDYNYTILHEDGVLYRAYIVNNTNTCNHDSYNEDSELSHKTKYHVDSIGYWTKYMSIATLVGCVPLYYSTGLLIMGVPIPLPIIYIPIKAIKTRWGVIVIGLGVCGISISPMVYYVNISNNLESVIPNLAITALETSINIAKQSILNHTDNIKTHLYDLSNSCDETLTLLANQIEKLESEHTDLKANKPQKPVLSGGYGEILNIPNLPSEEKLSYTYDKDTQSYKSNIDVLTTYINTIKTDSIHVLDKHNYNTFKMYCDNQINYLTHTSNIQINIHVINDKMCNVYKYKTSAVKGMYNTSVQPIDTVHSTYCNQIKDAQTSLDKLYNSINKIHVSNPIGVMMPNSVNFGPTIKSFNLVTMVDDAVNKHFNIPILRNMTDKLLQPSEVYLSNTSKVVGLSTVLGNIANVTDSLVVKDVLPKYEKLSVSNAQFLLFLTSKFCVKGAKQFGLVGYPQ